MKPNIINSQISLYDNASFLSNLSVASFGDEPNAAMRVSAK